MREPIQAGLFRFARTTMPRRHRFQFATLYQAIAIVMTVLATRERKRSNKTDEVAHGSELDRHRRHQVGRSDTSDRLPLPHVIQSPLLARKAKQRKRAARKRVARRHLRQTGLPNLGRAYFHNIIPMDIPDLRLSHAHIQIPSELRSASQCKCLLHRNAQCAKESAAH
jgi:hypothetical protein